jgi:hypothetical protein
MTRPNAFRTAMKTIPTYVTWIFYPTGMGSSDPFLYFDDAIDQYADAKDEGYDAIIWKFESGMYPEYSKSPNVKDVTDEADTIINTRIIRKNLTMPKWLSKKEETK